MGPCVQQTCFVPYTYLLMVVLLGFTLIGSIRIILIQSIFCDIYLLFTLMLYSTKGQAMVVMVTPALVWKMSYRIMKPPADLHSTCLLYTSPSPRD